MQPTITIYTSPGCVYCRQAKEYFASKNLSFTEKDVSTDAEAFNYVVKEIGQAVTPIIKLDHEVVVGFDRQKIDEILDGFHSHSNKVAA